MIGGDDLFSNRIRLACLWASYKLMHKTRGLYNSQQIICHSC